MDEHGHDVPLSNFQVIQSLLQESKKPKKGETVEVKTDKLNELVEKLAETLCTERYAVETRLSVVGSRRYIAVGKVSTDEYYTIQIDAC